MIFPTGVRNVSRFGTSLPSSVHFISSARPACGDEDEIGPEGQRHADEREDHPDGDEHAPPGDGVDVEDVQSVLLLNGDFVFEFSSVSLNEHSTHSTCLDNVEHAQEMNGKGRFTGE